MAIQMRRGQEVNFDADKMLPGEWAVSLDTKYVRMCFAPGVCVRMATYDAFEMDMAKIEAILAECQSIEEVVTRINTEVSANAKAVEEYTEQAKQYRDEAKLYKEQASAIVGVDIASKTVPGLMAGGENAVENGVLTLTKTTTSRTLTESENGGLKINSIDGESQQTTYSGKQLFNVNDKLSAFSTTATIDKDGWITDTIDNTAGTTIKYANYHTRISDNLLTDTDYLIVTENESNTAIYPVSNNTGNDNSQFKSLLWVGARTTDFTVRTTQSDFTNSTKMLRTFVEVPAGTKATVKFRISVLADTTINKDTFVYEPYVGGTASPNPNYKQDIRSVEISEILTHGKNLWNLGNVSGTRYVNKSFSLEAGTYTISAVIKSSDTDNTTSLMNFVYEDGSTGGVTLGRNTRVSKTVKFPKNITNAYLYAGMDYSKSADDTFSYSDIQIEEGSVATPYEPYTESREELSETITLRGIGDAKDVLVKKDGVYEVAREYIPFVIDGTQEIYRETAGENGYRFRLTYSLSDIYTPASMSTVADMMCDKFTASKWTDIYYGRASGIGTNAKQIGWFDEKFKNFTVDEMKAWLTENPISGFYRLATPTFEPLPLADQIALHRLETFGGVTYLFTDSTIEPIMEVEYGTSKVGGYALGGYQKAEANRLLLEQLNTLTNELATQLVAGSEG